MTYSSGATSCICDWKDDDPYDQHSCGRQHRPSLASRRRGPRTVGVAARGAIAGGGGAWRAETPWPWAAGGAASGARIARATSAPVTAAVARWYGGPGQERGVGRRRGAEAELISVRRCCRTA
jgi:hypothetical protein